MRDTVRLCRCEHLTHSGLDGSGGAMAGSGLAAPSPIVAAKAKYVAANADE